MTPQELAALPVGTRVKIDLRPNFDQAYDYGVIVQQGVEVQIMWEGGPTSIIYTQSQAEVLFIADISVAQEIE